MFHDSPALIKAACRAHQVTWDRRRTLRAMFQLDGLLGVMRTPLRRPGYGLSSLRYGHCVTGKYIMPKNNGCGTTPPRKQASRQSSNQGVPRQRRVCYWMSVRTVKDGRTVRQNSLTCNSVDKSQSAPGPARRVPASPTDTERRANFELARPTY